MYLIRLFKIRCHLRQKLIRSDPDIHRKAELIPDLILDLVGHRHRIRIDQMGTGHVEKHLVNGKGLHRRRIGRADFLKRPGTSLVQRKITRYAHEIRTFPQRQSHRFPCRHPIFFRRDRFRHNDAAP